MGVLARMIYRATGIMHTFVFVSMEVEVPSLCMDSVECLHSVKNLHGAETWLLVLLQDCGTVKVGLVLACIGSV